MSKEQIKKEQKIMVQVIERATILSEKFQKMASQANERFWELREMRAV